MYDETAMHRLGSVVRVYDQHKAAKSTSITFDVEQF